MSWLILGPRKLPGDKKESNKPNQKQTKGLNYSYLLQSKKGKSTFIVQRALLEFARGSVMAAKVVDSWCQALGSGLLGSGLLVSSCCHGPGVQWEQWPRAQPPWELPAWCSVGSQGVCFLVGVFQQLSSLWQVSYVAGRKNEGSCSTADGFEDRFFSMVGSPCGYGGPQNSFGGQIWFCCLFLPHLGLKQLKAIAQS